MADRSNSISGRDASEPAAGVLPVWQRLAFWRAAALNRCSSPFPTSDARSDSRAPSRHLLVIEAGEFWQCAPDGRAVSRSARQCRSDGGDEILLSAVLEGESMVRHLGGETRLRPGDIFVYDFAQPIELRSRADAEIHLVLPRLVVRGSLNAEPVDLSGRVLNASSLQPLLFEGLRLLARIGPPLERAARHVAFDSLVVVALESLREEHCNLGPRRGRSDAALFAAAQRFVEQNFASPDLTPEGLGAALGCSRAHLYRLFARRGLAVAGYIQEVRLRRGWAVLAAPNGNRPLIGDVAFQCGFEDPAVFSRAFKRRFGSAPREIRQAHRTAVPPMSVAAAPR
jgi:AraC-like DNA-binding protein